MHSRIKKTTLILLLLLLALRLSSIKAGHRPSFFKIIEAKYPQETFTNHQKDSTLSFHLKQVEYHRGESIKVIVKGIVMLNGACSNSQLIWQLERKNKTSFEEIYSTTQTQMDCGLPFIYAEDKEYTLIKLAANQNDELLSSYAPTKFLPQGTYRLLLFNLNRMPVFSEEFEIN